MRAIPNAVAVQLLLMVLLLSVAPWRGGGPAAARALNFSRADFPRDFVFGAGTSAYQVLPVLLIGAKPSLAGSV
jgi:beta-glucosidase